MDEVPLTTGDVAKRLNRSTDRIRQLERQGKLPAHKTQSGQRLFKASDVDRFAKELLVQEVKSGR